jgi:hypothetical protein
MGEYFNVAAYLISTSAYYENNSDYSPGEMGSLTAYRTS